MRKPFLALLILTLANTSIAVESKCSPENLEKLVNLSAKIIGELGQSSIATARLFSSKEIDKMSSKEIKTKFFKIKDDQSKKTMPAIDEIAAVVNSHPEYDKNNNFSLKSE